MGNPTNTTDYPAFSATLGKQAALRALWAGMSSRGRTRAAIYRLSNTDWNSLTDKSSIYDPSGVFQSVV